MRAEVIERVKPVEVLLVSNSPAGIFVNRIVHKELSDDPETADREAKQQFQIAQGAVIKHIREQKDPVDCFILYLEHVYKVFASSQQVKKITGQEAKDIKRQMKSQVPTHL